MIQNKNRTDYGIIIFLILIACFSRIIPHIPNFTPLGAVALFGASYFKNKIHAFIIPIASLWISDLIINNYVIKGFYEEFVWLYDGFLFQYISFIVITYFGIITLKKINYFKIFGIAVTSSIIFFLITNFGVWLTSNFYPKNILGIITCYTAALPFYKGTLSGFLFYSMFLFGTYDLSNAKFNFSNI